MYDTKIKLAYSLDRGKLIRRGLLRHALIRPSLLGAFGSGTHVPSGTRFPVQGISEALLLGGVRFPIRAFGFVRVILIIGE